MGACPQVLPVGIIFVKPCRSSCDEFSSLSAGRGPVHSREEAEKNRLALAAGAWRAGQALTCRCRAQQGDLSSGGFLGVAVAAHQALDGDVVSDKTTGGRPCFISGASTPAQAATAIL